ncbi:hypothetical protein OIE62_20425 [Streptomyces scopuliridis]|uniref:Uncharacterized protein n=1 Tax=Streptomyces scopuliridis TaxID=452529 RepID=A0ACD4ZKZ3_9ACTN|nr:hypothetical protein [Streptomyces scopuliridis]WSB34889.1 hypothetical protein OG949_19830 [Streptomyces scopuliridis]WSB99167.1 hypothetical protein OG835_20525 [Streptomyces scopuliridis]WSC07131.1 hypothetical protein OIE62_20425 [Streptomyces scopuliridis]
MVTNAGARPLPAPTLSTGHWCEAAAHTPDSRTIWLNSHRANSPRLALRWMCARVQDVTDQLDQPYAKPGHHWLTDEAERERARTTLAHGQTYVLTLYDDTTRYVLSARPAGGTR